MRSWGDLGPPTWKRFDVSLRAFAIRSRLLGAADGYPQEDADDERDARGRWRRWRRLSRRPIERNVHDRGVMNTAAISRYSGNTDAQWPARTRCAGELNEHVLPLDGGVVLDVTGGVGGRSR